VAIHPVVLLLGKKWDVPKGGKLSRNLRKMRKKKKKKKTMREVRDPPAEKRRSESDGMKAKRRPFELKIKADGPICRADDELNRSPRRR
jgi:hypothetical protein